MGRQGHPGRLGYKLCQPDSGNQYRAISILHLIQATGHFCFCRSQSTLSYRGNRAMGDFLYSPVIIRALPSGRRAAPAMLL
jgi:hypothetical protein